MSSVERPRAASFEFSLPKRLPALDGLRGLAALVVVVHHGFLTVPVLAGAYYGAYPKAGPVWLLAYTPLHFLWDGTNAVYLFFMLSGIVLVLPVLRSRAFDWSAYYVRRLVRIYGPVMCALVLAYAVFFAIPRSHDVRLGVWVLGHHPDHLSISGVLHDLTLIQGTSGVLSPLWSLQWEAIFSALLPLFVAFALLTRRRAALSAAAVIAGIILGSTSGATNFFFLPMFALGAVLVARWDLVSRAAVVLGTRHWVWLILLPLVISASTFSWWIRNFGVGYEAAKALRWVDVLGIMALLIVVVCWAAAGRLFGSRLMQWLGRISFSLYLTHEPILLGSRFLLDRLGLPSWLPLLITLAVAPVVAHAFARFIEQPLVGLARGAGNRFSTALRASEDEATSTVRAYPTTGGPVARPSTELLIANIGD